jgi:23S rRNA (adenine2030-N6)-methyltransferase
MNYRHAFHAGNFADLLKHAVLTRLLRDMTARPSPLTVIDTHAGAGLYDLRSDPSRRTGEAEAGISRLRGTPDAPAAFADLLAAVARVNSPGEGRYYPGSPAIIAGLLRPRDRYIACEVRADDHAALSRVLRGEVAAVPHLGDGWLHAAEVAPKAPAGLLVLIDPPFERGDDYTQALALVAELQQVNPGAVTAVWVPIKDLATYDAFLGEIEDIAPGAPVLAAEVRIRPLSDPMRLNGCAVLMVNPPAGLGAFAGPVVEWLAMALGEAGAAGRITRLGGAG